MKTFALAACLIIIGCAASPPPLEQPKPTYTELTTHLPDTDAKGEHDETQAEGITTEWYPNKQAPQQIIYRFPDGGMIDSTCLVPAKLCRHW